MSSLPPFKPYESDAAYARRLLNTLEASDTPQIALVFAVLAVAEEITHLRHALDGVAADLDAWLVLAGQLAPRDSHGLGEE